MIRKEVRDLPFNLNPGVKAYFVELIPPTLTEPLAHFERLSQALEKEFGLKGLSIDFPALKNLPQSLRKKTAGNRSGLHGRKILEVIPGRMENIYGVAVDIGTTTVALYLCNFKNGKVEAADSIMNPQVSHGEDVMSRISYAMQHPIDGLKRMHEESSRV